MIIKTSDGDAVKNILKEIVLPGKHSHKGNNGRLLIIGGSSLFHAASLWAAEVASHFVDMVHYSSTIENEKIFYDLKKTFRNGMVVPQKDLDEYIVQDDAILIGPGMMREGQEGKRTLELTRHLIERYPEKKYVFDAGALQMMDKEWLKTLKTPPILTPHMKEFESLFGTPLDNRDSGEIERIVKETAIKYRSVIVLKAVTDYVSDGEASYQIQGGNAGLTKGGTGDVLSGLAASLLTKNTQLLSATSSSILLKKAAEELYRTSGYWYNVGDIIGKLPEVLKNGISL